MQDSASASPITLAGVFLAYAAVCFLGFVFVPETRGKTLEEIEKLSAAQAD